MTVSNCATLSPLSEAPQRSAPFRLSYQSMLARRRSSPGKRSLSFRAAATPTAKASSNSFATYQAVIASCSRAW